MTFARNSLKTLDTYLNKRYACFKMKKTLIILSLLASSLAAQTPHFYENNPKYKEYNPYKPNEIEIKEWRGKPAPDIEKELCKLNYPLLSRRGPYLEIDVNGKHIYVKKEYRPRFGVIEVPGQEFVDDGLYITRKPVKIDQPLYIASGKLRGSILTKLVVVYEKRGGGWLCYDAYWVFAGPEVGYQIQEAKARGATGIHLSPMHGLPVGKPKAAVRKSRVDNRTMSELLRDLEKSKRRMDKNFFRDSL